MLQLQILGMLLADIIPGKTTLEQSVLGIFCLILLGAVVFIYKQGIDSQKEQRLVHKEQLDLMSRKLDEAEKDREVIYNNYLDHFKSTELSMLNIIALNTDAFTKLNDTFMKVAVLLDFRNNNQK